MAAGKPRPDPRAGRRGGGPRGVDGGARSRRRSADVRGRQVVRWSHDLARARGRAARRRARPRVPRLPAASAGQARDRTRRAPRARRAGRCCSCRARATISPSSRCLRPVVKKLGARATLHVVDHADHGFDVLVRSGRTRGRGARTSSRRRSPRDGSRRGDIGRRVWTSYSARHAAQLIGLPESAVRSCIRDGLVGTPGAVPAQLSFRDLSALRTVKALVDAGLPLPRVRKELTQHPADAARGNVDRRAHRRGARRRGLRARRRRSVDRPGRPAVAASRASHREPPAPPPGELRELPRSSDAPVPVAVAPATADQWIDARDRARGARSGRGDRCVSPRAAPAARAHRGLDQPRPAVRRERRSDRRARLLPQRARSRSRGRDRLLQPRRARAGRRERRRTRSRCTAARSSSTPSSPRRTTTSRPCSIRAATRGRPFDTSTSIES